MIIFSVGICAILVIALNNEFLKTDVTCESHISTLRSALDLADTVAWQGRLSRSTFARL